MLIADLIHSCSNEKVAEAALCCLGGRFAENVNVAAREKGVSAGAFVVGVIHDFAHHADASTRESLREKIVSDDQPLLEGLRTLLEGGWCEALDHLLGRRRVERRQHAVARLHRLEHEFRIRLRARRAIVELAWIGFCIADQFLKGQVAVIVEFAIEHLTVSQHLQRIGNQMCQRMKLLAAARVKENLITATFHQTADTVELRLHIRRPDHIVLASLILHG